LEILLFLKKHSDIKNTSLSSPQVAIIDCGMGNIMSVVNACNRINIRPIVVSNGDELYDASPSHIIMPGVGSASELLTRVHNFGIKKALDELVLNDNIAYLGICVGMQVLVDTCEEFGSHKGFGWIPGITRYINFNGDKVKHLPHVGWNTVNVLDKSDLLLKHFDNQDAYFIHSNAVETDNQFVLSTTSYGCEFASSIRMNNVYGVQFHPEKSSILGEKLLKYFFKK